MQYLEGTFLHEKINFHYHQFGVGEKIYIAFHGFGQTGAAFREVAEALGNNATLYSFDLPFHGSSEWKQGESPLLKSHWEEIFGEFLVEKGIERFTVLGYSLGGKLALASIEKFPSSIEKVILIAPDGIRTNFWYGLATYPHLLRKYFKRIIIRPGSFFKMMAVMNRLKFMDKGVLNFAASQMKTVRKRRKVYYTWVIFRRMNFNLKKITSIINEHEIAVQMYIGTYDKIITAARTSGFFKRLKNIELKLLTTGHNSILKKVASEIKTFI